MKTLPILTLAFLLSAPMGVPPAAEPQVAERLIGYTELRTNLPGGRHANARTSRAAVIRADGSGRRVLAEQLADQPDAWTQFAGWSLDGKIAVINRGWQDPENAKWEEEHRAFRMLPGKWLLDSYLLDMATCKLTNVTAVERVSHYNAASFLPSGERLLMQITLDGHLKQLTKTPVGSLHYHPTPSPDGKQLLYGSKRDGVRRLYVMNLADRSEQQVTDQKPGHAAMWPHWQPAACSWIGWRASWRLASSASKIFDGRAGSSHSSP